MQLCFPFYLYEFIIKLSLKCKNNPGYSFHSLYYYSPGISKILFIATGLILGLIPF